MINGLKKTVFFQGSKVSLLGWDSLMKRTMGNVKNI